MTRGQSFLFSELLLPFGSVQFLAENIPLRRGRTVKV
jgi:hypothetical protein